MQNRHNISSTTFTAQKQSITRTIEAQKSIEVRYKVCSKYPPCMSMHVRKRGIQLAQYFCSVLIGIAFQQSISVLQLDDIINTWAVVCNAREKYSPETLVQFI